MTGVMGIKVFGPQRLFHAKLSLKVCWDNKYSGVDFLIKSSGGRKSNACMGQGRVLQNANPYSGGKMNDYPLQRIMEFVRHVAPFDSLDEEALAPLVAQMEIAYFPGGSEVFAQGQRIAGVSAHHPVRFGQAEPYPGRRRAAGGRAGRGGCFWATPRFCRAAKRFFPARPVKT